MKIGLIGCGNIGKFLLQSLNCDGFLPDSRIETVYMRKKQSFKELSERYGSHFCDDFGDFLQSDIDLVIEAATIQAVRLYARTVIEHGKDLLIISVGALADNGLFKQLKQLSELKGNKIHLPSGAIGGLDVLKATQLTGQLESVTITTRKPAASLTDKAVDNELTLFDGPAFEAIRQFPKNINVSIILSLAGLGAEKTKVRIIADSNVTKNIHCIEATGPFGKFNLNIENNPMPNNPKTSYLAGLSILSTLKCRHEALEIG
ncbi:aspartate dehydrogenase [Scopulibacillus darangshiensis]|uniref:L-aspartate dehydrogenase n=1 Tax=Scopulibacillus darangshiensis TaxID=442528 RepID=A0A4R2P9I5_9BACL|nr:aspartate dehydrogenase [Scopulibacillus darangshiensis]TCP31710.1 aspartate dehydrogenase [Scopulibacillus darangshiensis]